MKNLVYYTDWLASPSGPTQSNWSGNWSGLLKTFSKSSDEPELFVTWEIGPYPLASNRCTTWRNTYSANGTLQMKKEYRFCRGQGSDMLYIDESNGMTIVAQWIDNILVHPFTYDDFIAVNLIRMRGDNLEEEKLIFEDKPAINGVISKRALSIQRLTMTRITIEQCN
ncbi:unnamed protein product [Rotaria sp. Silwood1]|nr:unnamed protein product [Rotaria sp. Silwood1]CAF0899606.1 unnamed protein product [Rotaria sp. Silwood1]CAF3349300.1 unnamed protein product [Rotaria sp. Silwood1]CAF3389879.1 unnamed protein product [Rotaria sp. Silwood1]CAF4769176.1 unnamed protein product [Rotaria sp. Silwood1]